MSPRSRSGRTKPELAKVRGMRLDLSGEWPASVPASRRRAQEDGTVVRLTLQDVLNAVHGTRNPVLQRYFVVTSMLAAGLVDLLPSQRSDNFEEDQEKVIFVLAGRVNVYLPETFDWFELFERDVLYLPANTVHQVWNYSSERASFAFKMVPG